MHVTNQQRVTAQMKVTKPDGTVTVHEVELDENAKRSFLSMIKKEK